jgi:transcriptional regulator with XRE-family HTH domain
MQNPAPVPVQAVADHLRLCIQARRLTLRSIERQLGMPQGYLGQLLRGNLDLKLKHLLAVLAAIGMEPLEFFESLGGRPALPTQRPSTPDLSRFDLFSSPEWRMGDVVPGLSAARLEQAVLQSLLRLGFAPSPASAKDEQAPVAPGRKGGRGR